MQRPPIYNNGVIRIEEPTTARGALCTFLFFTGGIIGAAITGGLGGFLVGGIALGSLSGIGGND